MFESYFPTAMRQAVFIWMIENNYQALHMYVISPGTLLDGFSIGRSYGNCFHHPK